MEMNKDNKCSKFEEFGILTGLIGPIVFGVSMLVAGLGYEGIDGQRYKIMNHFVSELGELGVSDLAWVFNAGLLVEGIATTFFVVVLAFQLRSWLRYPLGILGVITTVNAGLVGIYPMNYLGRHIVVAMNFFNLGMLISFLYSLVFLFDNRHSFPKWLAIPGLVNAGLFTWFLNFPSNESSIEFQEGMVGLVRNRPDFLPMALLEWAIVLGICLWLLVLASYLFVQCRKEKTGR